jgi:hypothetical protein
MIKSLKRNDIRYTPFVANKSWNAQNQRFEDLISWQSGSESGSLLLTFFDYGDGTKMSEVSSAFSSAIAYQQQDPDFVRFKIGKEITGSTFYTVDSKYYNSDTNPVNIDDSYQRLVYNTVKNLYYKESENPTQIFGLESLDTSGVNRSLPSQISVFSVPQNKFGEKIVPYSVKINQELEDCHVTAIDDGNTNLVISGSTFVDRQNANFNCVDATIQISNNNYAYDGSSKSVSVTTLPPNLTVKVTYNGSETPPTEVGVYSVYCEIVDSFYCGTKTGTLEITKAPATITVTSATFAYDGNPKTLSVTTIPAGLNYSLQYNTVGSNVDEAKNVGTYTVTATIVDSRYTGKSTGTLSITAAASSINFPSINNIVYGDFNFRTLSATDSINGFPIKYTITGGGNLARILNNNQLDIVPSKTAASLGTVTVKAETMPTINGFASVSTTVTFTVTQKSLQITGVSANNIKIGDSTTININNQTANLIGIVDGNIVTINLKPSTGTITSSASEGSFSVTLSSNYTITGTDSAKYSLTQPSITVKVDTSVSIESQTVTYDTYPYFVGNGITFVATSHFNKNDTYYISYGSAFSNKIVNGVTYPTLYRTDKYVNYTKVSSVIYPDYNVTKPSQKPLTELQYYPLDANTYKIFISKEDPIRLTSESGYLSTATVTIKPTTATVVFDNLTQVNSIKEYPYTTENLKNVKTVSDEIKDVKINKIYIPSRNGDIDITNSVNPTITYNGSNAKPSAVGTYKIVASSPGTNISVYQTANLNIGDFIYIFTDIYNFSGNNLTRQLNSDITSSSYNLKKYYDPSVTGSWNTVKSTHPTLNGYTLQRGGYDPEFEIVGGGGPFIPSDPFGIDTFSINSVTFSNFKQSIITKINDSKFTENVKQLAKIVINAIPASGCELPTSQENNKYNLKWTPNIPTPSENCTNKMFAGLYAVSVTNTDSNYSADFTLDISIERQSPYTNDSVLYQFTGNGYGKIGGSGASISFTLPSKYVIDKNLQSVKAYVGKNGKLQQYQIQPVSSEIKGYLAEGNAPSVSRGEFGYKQSKLIIDPPNSDLNPITAPILKNFIPVPKYRDYYGEQLIGPVPIGPNKDLIFVGNSVTQEQLNNYGILTARDQLYIVQANDVLSLSFNGYINDFLLLGYQIWDVTTSPSIEMFKNFTQIFVSDHQAPDRQYVNVKNENFTIPSSFKSTDVLVISFRDYSANRRWIAGLHNLNLTVNPVSISLIGDPVGGNSYFITGSQTGSQYALLGIIAGGAQDKNAGTSSVYFKSYNGTMYGTQGNSDFTNAVGELTNINEYYNTAYNGKDASEGGEPVDFLKVYGKYGVRGNYTIKGFGIREIYANSSSVYNINYIT